MYFNLAESIVDRLDLSIEEKMACVVLARYANNPAFEGLITLSVIAKKMAVEEVRARQALLSLREKGLIGDLNLLKDEIDESKKEQTASDAKIITADQASKNELSFPEFTELKREEEFIHQPQKQAQKQTQKQPKVEKQAKSQSKKNKVQNDKLQDVDLRQVAAIFEEIVPKNRLKILYGLAGGDIDKLKSAYQIVKQSNKFDVIDALAEYLQKPEQAAPADGTKTVDDAQSASLDFEEAKTLLNILESELEPEQVIRKGKTLNRQINLGKVKNAYKTKK